MSDLLNDLAQYYSFIVTPAYKVFVNCKHRIICLFTGNQSMKTSAVARSYVQRILRNHPVPEKNIQDNDVTRVFRFVAENLPISVDGGETRNTQYSEFKKWLPPSLIKRDISQRNQIMIIADPYGGDDIKVEFLSYGQTVSSTAGFQRKSVWLDEHSPKGFYEEQLPRLIASNGDLIYSLTPIQEHLGWEYDELFENACFIYRTKAVRDRILSRQGKKVPEFEYFQTGSDIAVIMAATDDNPTLSKEVIEETFNTYADEDVIDIRRYGLFKQISGQIFKELDKGIHLISYKTFTNGIPHHWLHARAIDYHQHNDWYIVWVALSLEDEAFVYKCLRISPEKNNVLEICRLIASMSMDYKYNINLIDPLSAENQPSVSISVLEDINRIFHTFHKEGLCSGGYWQTWDTKSGRGRDEIKRRLKNATIVGRPFNNRVISNGRTEYIPTLWILEDCKEVFESMKNWRKEEWAHRDMLISKDQKDKPQQRWSHYPMCLEALFKSPAFSVGRYRGSVLHRERRL